MAELYQIYLVTNLVNNKKYVGQVLQRRGYKLRFYEHLVGTKYANTHLLSNAIKKYGEENFKVELIEENIPEDFIDEKEIYYIKLFNTYYINNNGYNMTIGGQGIHGYLHSAEDIKKISDASKKHWDELRKDKDKLLARNKKISDKLKGKPRSEIARYNQSISAKKRFENTHGTFFGKKHTKATKRKIAEKNGNAVVMCDKNTNAVLKTFLSAMEASRYLIENKITTNKSAFTRIITICKKVKGQGKTAYGFIWRYTKEQD